jgi:tRNA threonylcarbamoyladenosine biosynthesis protein TsaB
MKILALETSTDACSAALYLEGEVQEHYQFAPQQHARLILPMVDALMAEAELALGELDVVALGRGPGSFTGVRIAVAVGQAIAFAQDLRVAAVSSLAALAQGACRELGATALLAAFDARMGEVYWGEYRCADTGLVEPVRADRLLNPAAVPLPPPGEWFGVGPGWPAYASALEQRLAGRVRSWDGARWPRARDVATLAVQAAGAGALLAAEQVLPVYLRDQVVTQPDAPAARRGQPCV